MSMPRRCTRYKQHRRKKQRRRRIKQRKWSHSLGNPRRQIPWVSFWQMLPKPRTMSIKLNSVEYAGELSKQLLEHASLLEKYYQELNEALQKKLGDGVLKKLLTKIDDVEAFASKAQAVGGQPCWAVNCTWLHFSLQLSPSIMQPTSWNHKRWNPWTTEADHIPFQFRVVYCGLDNLSQSFPMGLKPVFAWTGCRCSSPEASSEAEDEEGAG